MENSNLFAVLYKTDDFLNSYKKRAKMLKNSLSIHWTEPYTLFVKKQCNGKIHYWDKTITFVAVPNKLFKTHTIGGGQYTDYYFNDSVFDELRKTDKIHSSEWNGRFTLRPIENHIPEILATSFEEIQFIKLDL